MSNTATALPKCKHLVAILKNHKADGTTPYLWVSNGTISVRICHQCATDARHAGFIVKASR